MILDTSVLIAAERRSERVSHILGRLRILGYEQAVSISSMSVVELTHGMFRARTENDREKRRVFAVELYRDLTVHPISFEIAQLAGRIEGEQATLGNRIAMEDLLIGATALHLGFAVASLNVKHFARIPGLNVVSL